MNSHITDDFRQHFANLPRTVQERARKSYRLWQADPQHSSLHFKRVHESEPVYSVRVGRGWRALGLVEGDAIYWFWIGSHATYDKLLAQL